MTTATPPFRARTRWPFAVLFAVAGALVVAVVVLAFVWPAATARARDLPVGISGPDAQVAQLEAQAAAQDPNPFAFQTVASRDEAVQLIRERKIAGAFLLGTDTEVLTASAGSAAATQALRGVAASIADAQASAVGAGQGQAIASLTQKVTALEAQLQAAAAGAPVSAASSPGASAAPTASAGALPTVTVTDVVPVASDDPTGSGMTAAAFPMVLGGMLGGVLISLLVVGVGRRVAALLVYAVAAGALTTLVLQGVLHVLQGDWVLNAAGFGLAMLATAAVVVGFNSLIGPAGIGVGAIISILIGNPISGAASPHQFIPAPWGDVGQFFVAGAASNLVRSLSYFPDADTTTQWLVLTAWTVGGLVLTVVGHFRNAAPVRLPAEELEPVAA